MRDRYNLSIVSLVVLGDERVKWRPRQFRFNLWGCEVSFKFPTVKLLDYRHQWAALEASDNPFATVVMAHLKARETRKNVTDRKQWKLYLAKRLYERGYNRLDVINLIRFIDWLMRLPESLEADFWQEIKQYQEQNNMPYITSLERLAEQQGEQRGEQRGLRTGLLSGIELALELKFGSEGLQIFPEIQSIEAIDTLEAIQRALKTVTSIDELRQIYQQNNS